MQTPPRFRQDAREQIVRPGTGGVVKCFQNAKVHSSMGNAAPSCFSLFAANLMYLLDVCSGCTFLIAKVERNKLLYRVIPSSMCHHFCAKLVWCTRSALHLSMSRLVLIMYARLSFEIGSLHNNTAVTSCAVPSSLAFSGFNLTISSVSHGCELLSSDNFLLPMHSCARFLIVSVNVVAASSTPIPCNSQTLIG